MMVLRILGFCLSFLLYLLALPFHLINCLILTVSDKFLGWALNDNYRGLR